MNPALLALLPGAMVGLGMAIILIQFAPRLIRVDDALARLGDLSLPGTIHEAVSKSDRLGLWISRRMPNIPGFAAPERQLDLLEIPVSRFYSEKLQLAALGFLLPLMVPLVFQLTLGFFFPLPLLISPMLAAIMWIVPDAKVAARARQARREFTRFVTVYLELVAVALLGNTTADSAMASAASVSDSSAFRRIRQEYRLAELTRVSKWDALERLGDQLEVPALTEMSRVMRMAEARVGLRDQLRAACTKLRHQVAADDAAAAARLTQRMSVPVFMTLVPILAIVMAPTLIQLTAL